MNFIFLRGTRDQALSLVLAIQSGKLIPNDRVRIWGHDIDATFDPWESKVFDHCRGNELWPFVAQNDEDEMLIRMIW